MPATIKTEVVGVKDTIKALRRIDPELRKQFNRDMKSVLAGTVAEIKAGYPNALMSGTVRDWTPNLERGYQIFPWNAAKVRRGVTVKTSTRKNKNSVVYISQSVPGGILFETVSLNNELGRNIRTIAPRSIWPTVDRNQGEILDGVQKIVVRVGDLVQKEIG
jgi:hypothetical protein